MFADLKNDFVFRRIFAHHPNLTAALLNDLLTLEGSDRIVSLELLPPEQVPVVAGAKFSILDLKARDESGRTFVVEMQLLHVPGFLNRVVFNACKAYVGQLGQGQRYHELNDVVAVSLCDFLLWPDPERKQQDLPLVPLVSRWQLTEQHSGVTGLLQVQYVFVELPKVAERGPQGTPSEQWAWLFRYGTRLDAIPTDLNEAQRGALHLAEEATFTLGEQEAYRKTFDEIDQTRLLAEQAHTRGLREGIQEGRQKGRQEGLQKGLQDGKAAGLREGLRDAIVDLCDVYEVELTAQRQTHLQNLSLEELREFKQRIKQSKGWPS